MLHNFPNRKSNAIPIGRRRPLSLIILVFLVTAAAGQFSQAETAYYCSVRASNQQTVEYFSEVFAVPNETNTEKIEGDYMEFVDNKYKERVGRAYCIRGDDMHDARSRKDRDESKLSREGWQIVETGWRY